MANTHFSVKYSKKSGEAIGKAKAHFFYISRLGGYKRLLKKNDEILEYTESGNLPKPFSSYEEFWAASDSFERENGSVYKELEIALPRSLTPSQRLELVKDFLKTMGLTEKHVYSFAIHNKKASDGLEQPHLHFMFCERELDGITRAAPSDFFKRYNSKNPEKGGARKSGSNKKLAEQKEELIRMRKLWEEIHNRHCPQDPINMDSYATQGIKKEPQRHRGPNAREKDKTEPNRSHLNANEFDQYKNQVRGKGMSEYEKLLVKFAYEDLFIPQIHTRRETFGKALRTLINQEVMSLRYEQEKSELPLSDSHLDHMANFVKNLQKLYESDQENFIKTVTGYTTFSKAKAFRTDFPRFDAKAREKAAARRERANRRAHRAYEYEKKRREWDKEKAERNDRRIRAAHVARFVKMSCKTFKNAYAYGFGATDKLPPMTSLERSGLEIYLAAEALRLANSDEEAFDRFGNASEAFLRKYHEFEKDAFERKIFSKGFRQHLEKLVEKEAAWMLKRDDFRAKGLFGMILMKSITAEVEKHTQPKKLTVDEEFALGDFIYSFIDDKEQLEDMLHNPEKYAVRFCSSHLGLIFETPTEPPRDDYDYSF